MPTLDRNLLHRFGLLFVILLVITVVQQLYFRNKVSYDLA